MLMLQWLAKDVILEGGCSTKASNTLCVAGFVASIDSLDSFTSLVTLYVTPPRRVFRTTDARLESVLLAFDASEPMCNHRVVEEELFVLVIVTNGYVSLYSL